MAPFCLKSTVQDGAGCVMVRGINFGTRLGLLVPGERYNLYSSTVTRTQSHFWNVVAQEIHTMHLQPLSLSKNVSCSLLNLFQYKRGVPKVNSKCRCLGIILLVKALFIWKQFTKTVN